MSRRSAPALHDPARGNVPYKIAGMRVAEALSFYYPADLVDGGVECRDLRLRPCPAPPPPPGCRSRRVITLHLPRLTRATVTVDGRRVRVRRRTARIDLRGETRRRVTVRIRGRDARGRAISLVRRYGLCAP